LFALAHQYLWVQPRKQKKWTFDFNNFTVSEALNQISRETGIQIYISKGFNEKLIHKSYHEASIEEIISDILRKKNYAIVWSFSGNRLCKVEISTFKGNTGRNGFESANNFSKERIQLKRDRLEKNNYISDLTQNRYPENKLTSSSLQSKPASYIEKSKTEVLSGNSKSVAIKTRTILYNSGNDTFISGRDETLDAHGVVVLPPPSMPEDLNNTEPEEMMDTLAQIPEKWHQLESPPMPPGFASVE